MSETTKYRWNADESMWEFFEPAWGGWCVLREGPHESTRPMDYAQGVLYLVARAARSEYARYDDTKSEARPVTMSARTFPPMMDDTNAIETAWVIVRGPAGKLEYYTGVANAHVAWSPDHMRAMRFPDSYAANAAIGRGLASHARGAFLPDARTEEHMWGAASVRPERQP